MVSHKRARLGHATGVNRRSPSIHDVARRAGVSAQTVSRVLNGHPNVRPTTHASVTAAMKELGYRPNNAARSLRGNSRILGVLSTGSSFYGPAATLYGLEAAASVAGYGVAVVNLVTPDPDELAAASERLLSLGVAGVVAVLPLAGDLAALAALSDVVPVVLVAGAPADGAAHVVDVDNVGGAAAAVRHLLGLGHRTVFHVAGPPTWQEATDRRAGWQAALEEAGAEVPPVLVGDWSARSGFEQGRLLARLEGLTAVFAANDQMALGVLRALAERGLDVPGDVSVVGFDDIPESEFYLPPLTTVRQDLAELGRRCVEMLLARITDGEPTGPSVLEVELVVRSSTASPRRGSTD